MISIFLFIVAFNLTIPIAQDTLDLYTTNLICQERGHISSGSGMVTLAYYFPKYTDYEDSTVMTYHDMNHMTYTCERCGKTISEPVMKEPIRQVIWRKKN